MNRLMLILSLHRASGRAATFLLLTIAAIAGATATLQAQSAQLALASGSPAADGSASTYAEAPAPADTGTDSMFPHFKDGPFWLSGQVNVIFQTHPPFRAKYTGANSLVPQYEKATSRVMTLYTGVRLNHSTELLFDAEEAGGEGLSKALGVAGFPNLDVVRNPTLSSNPYVARLMIHKVIALSKDTVENDRGPLSSFSELPARRLEIRAGKFGTVDFFDLNSVGSDSHLQFMNWTIDNNGGYDYAADTRGYTWGAMLEYDDRRWSLRFLEALMPTVANGIHFEDDLRVARAENLELELRPKLAGRQSVIRLLSYVNHGNMGDYQQAVSEFLQGLTPTPDITATRKQGTVKYGFGLNIEQKITKDIRGFLRTGWNEGQHESFVYTEVNQTIAFGGDISGSKWRRKYDRMGLAFVSNGISKAHQNYLALGGLGFLLGDGALNYGRETIVESYYTAHLWRGVFGALDLQHINNPGYNRARGPVWVPSIRLHIDF
jgi:high affinity Mn2+ porin